MARRSNILICGVAVWGEHVHERTNQQHKHVCTPRTSGEKESTPCTSGEKEYTVYIGRERVHCVHRARKRVHRVHRARKHTIESRDPVRR